MKRPNLKDPNDWLYALCSAIAAVFILATSAIALVYLIVMAPSEAHVLGEGEDPVGYEMPIICGIVFTVCLILVVKDLIKRMRGCPREEMCGRYMGTWMSRTATLFSLMIFTTIVVIGPIYLLGSEITEDFIGKMTTYENIASMMIAGPEEEFIFRVLLIGLPMIVICALTHRFRFRDVIGGFGTSRAALVLILISAVLFGLAHIDGWSVMKFYDTFVSGLLLGYVYVQYGVHVTIVAHSALDMISSMDLLFGEFGLLPLYFTVGLGAVLMVRSLFKIREYIPKNNLHEPFDGSLLEMWERR